MYKLSYIFIIATVLIYGYNSDVLSVAKMEEILNYHNSKRATVQPPASDMNELIWNEDGAKKALVWAKACTFKHDDARLRSTPKYDVGGQNLAYTTHKTDTWTSALTGFFNESFIYRYGTREYSKVVTHYTQMIWADTKEIGCGEYDQCPDGKRFFVCNYYPRGNWGDLAYPYTRSNQQSCDKCKTPCLTSGPYAGKLCANSNKTEGGNNPGGEPGLPETEGPSVSTLEPSTITEKVNTEGPVVTPKPNNGAPKKEGFIKITNTDSYEICVIPKNARNVRVEVTAPNVKDVLLALKTDDNDEWWETYNNPKPISSLNMFHFETNTATQTVTASANGGRNVEIYVLANI